MAFDPRELTLNISTNGYSEYRYDTLDLPSEVAVSGYFDSHVNQPNFREGDIIFINTWTTAVRSGTPSQVTKYKVLTASPIAIEPAKERGFGAFTASNFVIPFGDSITARMWRNWSSTGNVVVSGGVTTVTTSLTHNIPVGTLIRIALSPVEGLNGMYNVASTPSETTFTVATPTIADQTVDSGTTFIYSENDQNFAPGYIQFLQAYSLGRFKFGWNGSIGGDDTAEALARIDETLAQRAGRAIVMLGTNNSLQATSTDPTTALGNIADICEAFLNNGTAVDLCTVPPFGSGYADVSDTTKVTFMMEFNKGIRAYAQETEGVHLHDVYSWLTDPAETNGQALANTMESDGIHMDTLGCRIVGENMAANYETWLGTYTPNLPSSQSDCATFNSASKNKFTNCLYTVGSPASGSGWSNFAATGTNSVVHSFEARTVNDDGDTLGNNYKSVWTINESQTTLVFQDVTSRLTVGKTYKVRAAFTIDIDANTLTALCEISCGYRISGGFQRNIRSGVPHFDKDSRVVFETAPFTWPENTTNVFFYLRTVFNDSGSTATITPEWGRVELLELD